MYGNHTVNLSKGTMKDYNWALKKVKNHPQRDFIVNQWKKGASDRSISEALTHMKGDNLCPTAITQAYNGALRQNAFPGLIKRNRKTNTKWVNMPQRKVYNLFRRVKLAKNIRIRINSL